LLAKLFTLVAANPYSLRVRAAIQRGWEPSVTETVALSEAAARQIKQIAAADPAVGGLRVAVEGGGCSGFQYDIQLAEGPADDDLVIERDGAKLYIDPVSVPFLDGSVVDWVQELIGASFKVRNPNAKTSCGCGVSFSV
jgi:iron-sulfur cluster assembly accessory protein